MILNLHSLVIASVAADNRKTLSEVRVTDDHTIADQL